MQQQFDAIREFSNELYKQYKNNRPLALYNKLISKEKLGEDFKAKFIKGFVNFFEKYPNYKVEKHTKIEYNDRIYIEIGKFMGKNSDIIKKYLFQINALVKPSKELLDKLNKSIDTFGVDMDTPEGEFVGNLMGQIKENVGEDASNNPMGAVMGLMSSGILTDMMTGIQEGANSGSMDMGGLLRTMKGMLNNIETMITEDEDSRVTELEE